MRRKVMGVGGRYEVSEEWMRDDLAGMPEEDPIEWYLGRDGRKYGPLSGDELRRFRELGHLQAGDLLWRKGFSDWMPAGDVFAIGKKG
jgi:GYF domain 2